MPITAMQTVVASYAITLLCVIVVELHPRGRLGRIPALSSIAFVSAGGAAWSYAAFYQPSKWPEIIAHKPASDENDAPVRYHGRRGREIDPEAADGAQDDAGGNGRGNTQDVSVTASASGGKDRAIILSQTPGVAARADSDSSSDVTDTTLDCEGCPPMVMVPAGATLIGARNDDENASPAERPRTKIRFWPGYLISAEPVSAASFQDYMAEANRRVWSCVVPTASLDPTQLLIASSHASCVMPGDADGYAAWARTGKAFRVPTVAEWEYAARTLPPDQMTRGSVSEIVADCWHARIPPQGRERIAAHTAAYDCGGRMLMGSAAREGEIKPRLSTRERLGARETRREIGFRVMRPITGGR